MIFVHVWLQLYICMCMCTPAVQLCLVRTLTLQNRAFVCLKGNTLSGLNSCPCGYVASSRCSSQ